MFGDATSPMGRGKGASIPKSDRREERWVRWSTWRGGSRRFDIRHDGAVIGDPRAEDREGQETERAVGQDLVDAHPRSLRRRERVAEAGAGLGEAIAVA